jgi:cell division protein FtsN
MKRLTKVLLLCVGTALFSACGTTEPVTPISDVDHDYLEALYKDAIRVPITPYIVSQVRAEQKEQLLSEIRYYTSVDIVLLRDSAGASSVGLETQALGESPQSSEAITILTFNEGASSLNQSKISRDDEGQLGSLSPEGDVFEIVYPERLITLGFVLNREKNWYDLEFAIEETGEGRLPLALTGTRPHLLIHYRTVSPDSGEARIQLDSTPVQPAETSSALSGQSSAMVQVSSPQVPEPGPAENVQPVADVQPEVDVQPVADAQPVVDVQPVVSVQPEDDAAQSLNETVEFVYETAQFVNEPLAEVPDDPVPLAPYSPPVLQTADLSGTEAGSQIPAIVSFEQKDEYEADPFGEVVLLMGGSADAAPGSGLVTGATEEPVPRTSYTVQVGAFRDQKNATLAYTTLERGGFNPCYEPHQNLTRVVIPAVDQKDLAWTKERLKTLGFGELYVRQ